MKTYYIGYMNKPWCNSDFVILATTKCDVVAGFIERSYNKGYQEAGMSIRAITLTRKELPKEYRYSH